MIRTFTGHSRGPPTSGLDAAQPWTARAVYTATRLGLFDALGGGSRPGNELAHALELRPEPLSRLLRPLRGLNLLERRPGARLLVTERMIPAHRDPVLALAFDLHMLVMTSGRERSEEEYAELLAKAGLVPEEPAELPIGLSLPPARKPWTGPPFLPRSPGARRAAAPGCLRHGGRARWPQSMAISPRW